MDAIPDAPLLLALDGVTKGFPGVQALKGVSLELARGEIHALLGENGAGKSTIIKIIGGIQHQDEGRILLDGREMRFNSYRDAIAAGIGIVFQEFSLVPDLDAVDNIFLGRETRSRLGLSRKAEMRARSAELMRRLGIVVDLDCPVGRLSVADQQFVEIAKALSLDARILILDEPTATLTPSEAEHLFRVMRQLRADGIGMFFVSHHLDEIFEICDRITVLRDGRNVGLVRTSETDMDGLVEMMVGRRLEASFPPRPETSPSEIVLEADGLRIRDGAPESRFVLHRGEIFGFAGLVGSGRTETALALIGAIPCRGKRVRIDGHAVKLDDPAAALAQGIGLLPENRKTQGLMLGFSIRENVSINNLNKYTSRASIIDRKKERLTTRDLMQQIRIKAPSDETMSLTLSGGNQQKVVIARWLNRRSRILIFDEPTRGIDVGAKAEIYRLMRALADEGCSIIMISSELPEIVGLCDRVAVFRRGAIAATLSGDSINPEEVMRHATAGNDQHAGHS